MNQKKKKISYPIIKCFAALDKYQKTRSATMFMWWWDVGRTKEKVRVK